MCVFYITTHGNNTSNHINGVVGEIIIQQSRHAI
jgi:hypothetical protein